MKNSKKFLFNKSLTFIKHFDYSKAQRELGYVTRSYAETIHDEVEWLKEKGLI